MPFFTKQFESGVVSVTKKVMKSVVSIVRGLEMEGQGSGVIISEDGYIVTNAHVVEKTGEVGVILPDGCHVRARVVGRSNIKDIAILKTDATGLSPIELGSYKDLEVGQFAIAIGNSLGLGTTVTFGMVSGLGRVLAHPSLHFDRLIQTSAPINPGNSGGALVDLDGRLVGIPTVMLFLGQGVGFAISVDDVKDIYERYIETGSAISPTLGIRTQNITPEFATTEGIPIHRGVYVTSVDNGPARTAGIKPKDVIVKVDDVGIYTANNLRDYIYKLDIGYELKVRIIRADEESDVTVVL